MNITRAQQVAEEIVEIQHWNASADVFAVQCAEVAYRRGLEDAADKMKRRADDARKSPYPWSVSSAAYYDDAERCIKALADEPTNDSASSQKAHPEG